MHIDPVTLQVIQARLAGIVQEMQNSLFRTGYSTIIRESQDASCAILNTHGEVVAQHVVLPLHMGAFPACAAGLLKNYSREELHEGDAFITNHPYLGGSPHAPDMAVLTPIFFRGDWVGFAVGWVLLWWRRAAGWAALGVTILLGVARVVAGVHWPIDIVGSALIAALAAWLAIATVSLWAIPQRLASRVLPAWLVSAP